MPKPVFEIDGRNFDSLEAFYDEVGKNLVTAPWGRNLDVRQGPIGIGWGMPDGKREALPPNAKLAIAIACVVPFVIAVISVVLEAWPATRVIDWLADEDGRYSVKAAIGYTFCLIGLAVVAGLIPVLVVVKLARARTR